MKIEELEVDVDGERIPLTELEEDDFDVPYQMSRLDDKDPPTVYRKDGVVLNNARALAVKELGLGEVRVVDIDETKEIQGEVVTEKDIREDIDSPLNIWCPECEEPFPLVRSMNGNKIVCEWCEEELQLVISSF